MIHHDRLRICKDRAIPLWMRRKRHHFLHNLEDDNLALFNDLDATVAYEDPLPSPPSQPSTPGTTQSIADPAVKISSEEDIGYEIKYMVF